MITCLFRFPAIFDEDPLARWIGVAVASNMKSLFLQIDKHGDPTACEIFILNEATAPCSVCVKERVFPEYEDKDREYSEAELFLDTDSSDWTRPTWGRITL